MDKTPIGRKFINRLRLVNDQICYSALLHAEFASTLAALLAARPKDFTTAAFPTNPHAERLYRRVESLPAFGVTSGVVGLQMGVIAAVEHALAYLEDIEGFRASVRPSPEDSLSHDATEEQTYLKLCGWSPTPPVRGHFRTLGYMRLLRNHFAHAHEEMSPSFSSYAAKYGHTLNRFWNNGVTNTYGFDFKARDVALITDDRAYAVMNLLRVSINYVDAAIASTIAVADVLTPIVVEILARKPELKSSPTRIASKARAVLEARYGERVAPSSLAPPIMACLQET